MIQNVLTMKFTSQKVFGISTFAVDVEVTTLQENADQKTEQLTSLF